MIENRIESLDNYWVITKKYNGTTYFYGSHYVKGLNIQSVRHSSGNSKYTNAKYAFTYPNKEMAENKKNDLNLTRKKLKYKVEQASKYLVTSIEAKFDYSNNLILTNNPISLHTLKEGKHQVKNLETLINSMKEILQTKLDTIESQHKRDIEYYEKQLKEQKRRQIHELNNFSELKNYITNLTVQDLEKYLTNNDKVTLTLYGNR
jgi:hypothetical protein